MSAASQFPAVVRSPPGLKRFRSNPPDCLGNNPYNYRSPNPSSGQLYIDTNGASPSADSYSNPLMEIKTEPQYSPRYESGGGNITTTTTPNMNSSHSFGVNLEKERSKKTSSSSCRPSEELCLVCGDRASGYHYNALACEGCKGFFRRSITKNNSYACKWAGNCEIDMYMRRKCQACRLKKCYGVGMRAECVVPERTCAQKREAKQRAQKQQVLESSPNCKVEALTGPGALTATGPPIPVVPIRLLTIKPLKPEEEELINRLVYFQEEYEHPSEDDLNRVYDVPMTSEASSESESDRLFRHMTEMTILTVQLIVEFSKHLPGFQTLCREDQISLLKGCSSEVMMLRGARRYDAQSDSIVYATNYPFTKENYAKAGLGNDELFRFCRGMSKMKVDNAEYALITAIVIFSERNSLREPKRVEKIQEIYVDALQAYVMANRKKSQMVTFAKLLFVLTELRSLGLSNSELCFSLKLKNRKLPPFLMEIWDIEY